MEANWLKVISSRGNMKMYSRGSSGVEINAKLQKDKKYYGEDIN